MTALVSLARARTDLGDGDIEHLRQLVAEWSLVADLAISDLVLWLPTWNDAGMLAAAHMRPATGPTVIPQDIVGTFQGRGRRGLLDRVVATRTADLHRRPEAPGVPVQDEAVPVIRDGRLIAVVERRASLASRPVGRLEEVYLSAADDLLGMVSAGTFPTADVIAEAEIPPRAGDGLIRLDERGVVTFASPNAVSAFHRLGLALDLEGAPLVQLTSRLTHRPGPVDEALALVASGRATGGAELENTAATVVLRSLPLSRSGRPVGALVLVRDVTDLRRRERALLTKDATIREVHHRVKNNLQTVAALLRLQARRAEHDETRVALAEAGRRVAAIGIVHETLATGRQGEELVDFDAVTDRLLALVREYAHPTGEVVLQREGSFGMVPGRIATPLSVVLTELLHNAVEHGLADRGGQVLVEAEAIDGGIAVTVADDGVGMPASGVVEGLGLQIVRTLVEDELRGTLATEAGASGVRARVTVPTADPSAGVAGGESSGGEATEQVIGPD